MRRCLCIVFFFVLSVGTIGMCASIINSKPESNDVMEEATREAQKIGMQEAKTLMEEIAGMTGETLKNTQNDLLPVNDQDKTLSPAQAKQQQKEQFFHTNPDIQETLKTAQQKEVLDGSEPELQASRRLIVGPQQSLGIQNLSTEQQPEEIKIETCSEGEPYITSVLLELNVEVVPGEITYKKGCKGHTKTYKKRSVSEAQRKQEKKLKELQKDSSVKSTSSTIKQNILTVKYTHFDDAQTCDQFTRRQIAKKNDQVTDTWVPNNASLLKRLQINPDCKELYSKTIQGTQIRQINGVAVPRDAWSKRIFFECNSCQSSKCPGLRAKGGVLISKKCVQKDANGECAVWEKAYDLGKQAAHTKNSVTFDEEEIWGLKPELTIPEKNTDIGSVLGTLAAFSEIEEDIKGNEEEITSKAQVFKGHPMKCQRTIVDGVLFDCCQKMSGLAIRAKLAHCNEDEQCLAQNRSDGKCQYLGTRQTTFGTITEQVYCCFPTKLARVIHEQGRKQLGIAWGDADHPKCQGFTLDELKRIDFSALDLSEVIEDFKIDRQSLNKKLQQKATEMIDQETLKQNTEQAVQPHFSGEPS